MEPLDDRLEPRHESGRALPDCRRLPGCEDRRSFLRVRRNITLCYRVSGFRWTRSRLLSLSATGARILLYEPVLPGQKVMLRLEMTSDWQPQARGDVVWRHEVARQAAIVGIRFDPLRAEDEDRLRNWVRREWLADLVNCA